MDDSMFTSVTLNALTETEKGTLLMLRDDLASPACFGWIFIRYLDIYKVNAYLKIIGLKTLSEIYH